MSKGRVQKSFLLNKYLEQYHRNPNSRVFAPLAETYRKLGMINEAFNILKKGLRKHPHYTLGLLVLANCYSDLNSFDKAYEVISSVAKKEIDNVAVQRLYASVCLKLGKLDEALKTLKYLLFLNPKDEEVQSKIKHLEDDLLVSQSVNIKKVSSLESSDDEWSTVSFFNGEDKSPQESSLKEPERQEGTEAQDINLNDWEMKTDALKNIEDEAVLDIHTLESSDELSELETDGELDEVLESDAKELEELDDFTDEEDDFDDMEDLDHNDELEDDNTVNPFITFTLVDLYESQGHLDKAIQILEKMRENNPHEQKVIERLSALQKKGAKEEEGEEAGHNRLMSIIDQKVNAKSEVPKKNSKEQGSEKYQVLKNKLENFLSLINERATAIKRASV